MLPFRGPIFMMLTFASLTIGAGWLMVHEPSEEKEAPQMDSPPFLSSVGSLENNQTTVNNVQPPPVIHVRGIVRAQEGKDGALLEVDHSHAQWFRCEEAIRPGYTITAIDKTKITVRDEQHNAYYEYSLNSGADDSVDQEQLGAPVEKESLDVKRSAMNDNDAVIQSTVQTLDKERHPEQENNAEAY